MLSNMDEYHDLEKPRPRSYQRRAVVWGEFTRSITLSFLLLAVTTAIGTVWLIAHIRDAKAGTAHVTLHHKPTFNASTYAYNTNCSVRSSFAVKQKSEHRLGKSRLSGVLETLWERFGEWEHSMQNVWQHAIYGCITFPTKNQMRLAYLQGVQLNVCKSREPAKMASYNNVSLNLTNTETPDPFVTYSNGRYYMTFTAGNRTEIWSSTNLLTIGHGEKKVVWHTPPELGGIWAPELHIIDGRWYIYMAAENPKLGNKSHRMYVLAGPPAESDPTTTSFNMTGQLHGMHNHWAIDGTVFPIGGKNYFIYSGWPLLNRNESDRVQELFIIEMDGATRVKGKPVAIAKPSEPWEKSGASEILEGPQALIHPDGRSWMGIAYSCAGSWTPDYKMNTLQLVGHDPLDPRNWRKSARPLLHNRTCGQKPFAPGHGCFMNVGQDTVSIFHAKDKREEGSWAGRTARIQRLIWTADGPFMGEVGPPVDEVSQYLAPTGPPGGRFPGGMPAAPMGVHSQGGFTEKLADILRKFR